MGGEMHEQLKNVIEKHREKQKQVEEYLSSQGNTQVSYSPAHIKMLVDSGRLPKVLGDWFFKDLNERQKKHQEMYEFKKNHPDIAQDEFIKYFFKEGQLSPEESAKSYEDMFFSAELLMYLLQNRELLTSDPSISEKLNKTLFADIDIKEDIGIVRAIVDCLYHLEKILYDMKLNNLYDNIYEAKGSINNSKGEIITLEYTIRASTNDDANVALEEYKNIMLKKGLRIWMAYWCSANEKGRMEYKCSLTEVMKWTADDEREASFSQKEREEFWYFTKMLGMTKLSRSRVVKKRGKGKESIQWIEQPLVEIFGGERPLENDEKYPAILAVRILMPKMGKNSFVPAVYKISTLKLNPNDIYLAFIVQTRASQMGRGERELFFDWDYLFEIGNLKQTAMSNSRMAKAKMRLKMDKLKKVSIIEKCNEQPIGMTVFPKKRNKQKTV